MTTIGLVANIYNEINALPGWLETHTPFFDDIRVLHAGPNGKYSDDGTIELLEKWNIPISFADINEGFGEIRTKAIRCSPCDYVMILDADERFYQDATVMVCVGESTPHDEADKILQTYDFRDLNTRKPDWEAMARLGCNLEVLCEKPYDQGKVLMDFINREKPDAVATIRRHWHDFTFNRPTQNWLVDCDWQTRIVRNHDSIFFDPNIRMHERLIGTNHISRADTKAGPFFDHFHLFFKKMEEKQRAHDVAIYDALHHGKNVPETI